MADTGSNTVRLFTGGIAGKASLPNLPATKELRKADWRWAKCKSILLIKYKQNSRPLAPVIDTRGLDQTRGQLTDRTDSSLATRLYSDFTLSYINACTYTT